MPGAFHRDGWERRDGNTFDVRGKSEDRLRAGMRRIPSALGSAGLSEASADFPGQRQTRAALQRRSKPRGPRQLTGTTGAGARRKRRESRVPRARVKPRVTYRLIPPKKCVFYTGLPRQRPSRGKYHTGERQTLWGQRRRRKRTSVYLWTLYLDSRSH